ncbi:MAG: RDD family protein [Candidatus Hodarchaeota archaeon]
MGQNEEIDMYIDEVSRFLPYPKSKKQEALDELRIDIESAMMDAKGESPVALFGTPRHTAMNVCQGQDWQNERANWRVRIFAWAIDLIIKVGFIIIYVMGGFFFLSTIIPYDEIIQWFFKSSSTTFDPSIFSGQGLLILAYISLLTITTAIAVFGYNVVLEQSFSATIGKKLLKISVVDESGIKITWKQAIIRNLSKIFFSGEFLLFFLPVDVILGMILEKQNPEKARNQRGLDILAETIVIKQK